MNTLIEFLVITWKIGRQAGLSKVGHELMAGHLLVASTDCMRALSCSVSLSVAGRR